MWHGSSMGGAHMEGGPHMGPPLPIHSTFGTHMEVALQNFAQEGFGPTSYLIHAYMDHLLHRRHMAMDLNPRSNGYHSFDMDHLSHPLIYEGIWSKKSINTRQLSLI